MMKKKNVRPYSVTQFLLRSLWVTIPVGVLFLIVSIYSFFEIQKQSRLSVETSVAIYQNELSHRLGAVQHFIDWSVVHDPSINAFTSDAHMGDLRQASTDLRSRVSDMQYSTGSEYQYFLYWNERELFVNASELAMDYSTFLDVKKAIIDNANSDISISERYTWTPMMIHGKAFLCYSLTYKSHTFASVVAFDDLLKPLGSVTLGKYGSIIVKNQTLGTFYKTAPEPSGFTSVFYNSIDFPESEASLPFDLELYSDLFSNYYRIFFLQVLVFSIALIIILVTGGYMLITYRKVIRPIKLFSENLSRLDSVAGDYPALDITDHSIHELNQINDQFKNLVHEITRLRIDIYEAELEKNRFRIHFLQQQIKPHFYLNCLTTIDSMLSIGEVDTARRMLSFTSRYLRYLFQADKDFVHLSSELSHIEDYINIQNLRLGNSIDYALKTSGEYDSVKVPPLLLITFVENVVKHAIPADDILRIRICCQKLVSESEDARKKFRGSEYFEISICDNGQGIPDEIIDKLSRQLPISESGEHIGITNSIRRLDLLYSGAFELTAGNMESGGARITIHLPYLKD